ncbi:20464_t:CDS:1, partial [Gigaspora rosea]
RVTNSITQNDLSNDESIGDKYGDNSIGQLLPNVQISLRQGPNTTCTAGTFSKFSTAITSSDTCLT